MDIILHDGVTPVPEGDCVIVTRQGFMLKRRSNWVDAIVPIQSVQDLLPLEARAQLLLPKIPSTVFAQAVLFFLTVYQKQKTEAAVLLHYRSADNDWQITVPEQTATGGSVQYDPKGRLPGYLCVGTMHSHCAMSAFHSGTDSKDEMGHDGIHLTIGRLDKFPEFEMDGEVVVNGTRFSFPAKQAEGLVAQEQETVSAWNTSNARMYMLMVPDTFSWSVPPEWVALVKERTFFTWKPRIRAKKPPTEDQYAPSFWDPAGNWNWGYTEEDPRFGFFGGRDPKGPFDDTQ